MKLTILQPVRHNDQRLNVGDTVDLKDESQARALLDCGAAELAAKPTRGGARDAGAASSDDAQAAPTDTASE